VFPASFSSWTSDLDPANLGWHTWDNFTLPQPTSISGVNWQGFYLDFINNPESETPDNNPVAPDTESWEIGFWSNVAANPGASIQAQTIPMAGVTTTFVAFTPFQGHTVPVYDFHADLTPFLADTGTTYWLSVLSKSATFNPVWSWMQGTGGDGNTIQDQLPAGTRLVRPGDRTFSLEGQVVPEPATRRLILFGLAIGLSSTRAGRRGGQTNKPR
jgi:hypothetical protein